MIKLLKKIYNIILQNNDISNFWKKYNYIKLHNNQKGGSICRLLKAKYHIDIQKIERKYNCFIPITEGINDSIVFPHELYGIFISQGAKIGKNCVIFHQVTIGSNTLEDSKGKGAPTIGNNVYIGAGAKIIGNVKIGDNCRIGANCVVVNDIPSNTTVVLGKNRLIMHKEKRDNNFIDYKLDSNI